MKRLVGLVVLAFASAGWAFPQAPPPSDAERDLRAFMKAVSQAIAARDRAALERYHAATFTSITRTGFVHDRAGWIELIAQGGLAVQKTDDEEQFDDELTMHGAAVAVRTGPDPLPLHDSEAGRRHQEPDRVCPTRRRVARDLPPGEPAP